MLVTALPAAVRAQDARSALANLPESQAVLYLNARRLMNEAAPSLVPREWLDKALAQSKPFIDLKGLEYVIVGVRLKGELSAKQMPEFLLIMRGNFSADALLSGARMMDQDMYTQETIGTKTLNIFTLNKPAPADAASGEQKKKFPIDQVAAVALDANTLAVGIPAYLRDAIDTTGGRSRLKPELVDLAMRDANTLVSLAADIPPGISQQLSAVGAPVNAEVQSMIDAVRQVQLAVNMQPATFGVQSIVRMENAERASALSGLINISVGFMKDKLQKDLAKLSGSSKDGTASTLKVLETLTNAARGNEVELNVAFQRAALVEMINKLSAPKKQETPVASAAAATPAPAAKKGTAAKRRPARRRQR
jgi:hypothetical protein